MTKIEFSAHVIKEIEKEIKKRMKLYEWKINRLTQRVLDLETIIKAGRKEWKIQPKK